MSAQRTTELFNLGDAVSAIKPQKVPRALKSRFIAVECKGEAPLKVKFEYESQHYEFELFICT